MAFVRQQSKLSFARTFFSQNIASNSTAVLSLSGFSSNNMTLASNEIEIKSEDTYFIKFHFYAGKNVDSGGSTIGDMNLIVNGSIVETLRFFTGAFSGANPISRSNVALLGFAYVKNLKSGDKVSFSVINSQAQMQITQCQIIISSFPL